MSDASTAKPRNVVARLGIIFAAAAVATFLVFGVLPILSVSVGTPDFLGPLSSVSGGVTLVALPALSVAGFVFGILGAVRARRLGEGGISLVAICLGAVFLIVSVFIIGLTAFFTALGPCLKASSRAAVPS